MSVKAPLGLYELLLHKPLHKPCLLYTSDAADERSSVDLGGRRIIKKKKNIEESVIVQTYIDKCHK